MCIETEKLHSYLYFFCYKALKLSLLGKKNDKNGSFPNNLYSFAIYSTKLLKTIQNECHAFENGSKNPNSLNSHSSVKKREKIRFPNNLYNFGLYSTKLLKTIQNECHVYQNGSKNPALHSEPRKRQNFLKPGHFSYISHFSSTKQICS